MALDLIAGGATVLHQKPAGLSVGLGHGLLLNALNVIGAQLGQRLGSLSHVVPEAQLDGGGERDAVFYGAVGNIIRIGVSRSGIGGAVVWIVHILSVIVVALISCLVACSGSPFLLPELSWDALEVRSPSLVLLSLAFPEPPWFFDGRHFPLVDFLTWIFLHWLLSSEVIQFRPSYFSKLPWSIWTAVFRMRASHFSTLRSVGRNIVVLSPIWLRQGQSRDR